MLVNRKCKLMYKIEYEPEENVQAFEEMQETLAQVGVDIFLTNGYLILSKSDTKYKEKTSRGAGMKRTAKWCSIIDVLIMLQTMTDKQIYTEIEMSPATYYRHKKAMLESDIYHSLDTGRINDMDYLQELRKDLDISDTMF